MLFWSYQQPTSTRKEQPMFGLLFTLICGVSEEIQIRKDIRNDRAESAKRCADFQRRMEQWEELKKKDYRRYGDLCNDKT